MGRKFCNVNIKAVGAEADAVRGMCYGLEVRTLADGWLTAVGDELDYVSVRKTAVRISKAVDVPVLSVYYFDEDYAEFVLYRNGRRIARHIPAEYEVFSRVRGKHSIWAEQLGLDEDAAGVLRVIFDETSPDVCLELLGCVVGCPLSCEADCEDVPVLPDAEYLEKYLNDKRNAVKAKKSAPKLKNRHTLMLVDEADGYFGHWLKGYPFCCTEFAPSFKRTLFDIRDGKLTRLFDNYDKGSFECTDYPESGSTPGVHLIGAVCFNIGRTFERYSHCVFTSDGEVVDRAYGNSDRGGVFVGNDRLFYGGVCRNFRTHSDEWRLYDMLPCDDVRYVGSFENGRFAVVCRLNTDTHRACIASLMPDGSLMHSYIPETSDELHLIPNMPKVFGNELYAVVDRRLICFDSSLHELWSTELGRCVGIGDNSLDRELGLMYLYDYGCIMAFDIAERKISAVREIGDGEHRYFEGILPGKGCIMTDDRAIVEVWDTSLECVSRHRRKGKFHKLLYIDGRVYIAANEPYESDGNSAADGHLWLYELT